MLTVYKYDTPTELKQENKIDKLRELMCKLYDVGVVEARIE
jgi:hypothetical protein